MMVKLLQNMYEKANQSELHDISSIVISAFSKLCNSNVPHLKLTEQVKQIVKPKPRKITKNDSLHKLYKLYNDNTGKC